MLRQRLSHRRAAGRRNPFMLPCSVFPYSGKHAGISELICAESTVHFRQRQSRGTLLATQTVVSILGADSYKASQILCWMRRSMSAFG
jgi:hypothetical protein